MLGFIGEMLDRMVPVFVAVIIVGGGLMWLLHEYVLGGRERRLKQRKEPRP